MGSDPDELLVFNLQRFSTEDGPGIRTTVFCKGCPLRCPWCHNPEGLSPRPELVWHDNHCIDAGECSSRCPHGALTRSPQGIRIDRDRCQACGDCAQACPAAALEVLGVWWRTDDLFAELQKDAVFFETSGGGITLSGGEPLGQPEPIYVLAEQCHRAGIPLALDTCGAVAWSRFEPLIPFLDRVLFDLKIIDPTRHRESVGADNQMIIRNVANLSQHGIDLWIRTPIIPGHTNAPENIAAIGTLIRDHLPTVSQWDLLAYTNLGAPKYPRLGHTYPLAETPLVERAEMEALHEVAKNYHPRVSWSGVTR